MVEIDYIDDTGTYVNYIDHNGDLYKGVYIKDAPLNVQIIDKGEIKNEQRKNYECHWCNVD